MGAATLQPAIGAAGKWSGWDGKARPRKPMSPGEQSRSTRPNRPLAWATTGIGGVCLATGAVFGTFALLDNGGRVNTTGDDHARARTEAHAADAFYGAGVVALGVGVWLLMRRDG